MHYYTKNIKDWHHATSHLNPEEEGIYGRLVDYYYDQEKPIPKETQPVFRRLRLTNHSDIALQILNEFFKETPDGWRHERCDIEIKNYQMKAEANRKNGQLGGRPRKNKGLHGNPNESENNPGGYCSVSESKPKITLTNNHKPITNNQSKNKRFKPPSLEKVTAYCLERHNSIDAGSFIDHYQANGWMRGKTKIKDWKACIRTWERNRAESNGNNRQHKSRSERASDAVDAAFGSDPDKAGTAEVGIQEVDQLRIDGA